MSPFVLDGCDLSMPAPGRLLPPRTFFSPAVFDAEMTRIFARSWVHVADLDELRNGGDFVAAAIGASPVVVLRGHDGVVRGFLNACPHRGATLADGRGNCGRQLRCPYHAWSFATDGRLVGASSRDEFACDFSTVALQPIRVACCGPMVFGCLDSDAPSFEEWIGELPEALARHGGDRLERAFEYAYEVDVNWKVYVENGLEGYHVAVVHDVLNDFVETKDARHHFEEHGSYTHASIKPEYRAMIPELPHLSAEERGRVRFGLVFPNLIPVLGPVEFSYLRIDPLGPERIRLVARSFDFGGDQALLRDFRRDAIDRTNRQDIGVVTRVQRGLHAHGFAGGMHSAFLESRIGHFERMVSRAHTGERISLARPGSFTRAQLVAECAGTLAMRATT
ncbi:MAG: aromatic ring-hydroxylating dioxygenase subunit alpha [Deltaproteobacteria bacterium]|nr:aromatic ring-hydroxylating dioxygenase subunit alpha [Deltaproteobacteria bacterium]